MSVSIMEARRRGRGPAVWLAGDPADLGSGSNAAPPASSPIRWC